MNDQKIVMQDSDEAAHYRTDIKGWVSRTGMYCGDGARGFESHIFQDQRSEQ